MGVCYSVDAELRFASIEVSKANLKKMIDKYELKPEADDFLSLYKCFFERVEQDGDTYMAEGNCSYGWSSVIDEMFMAIAPGLADDSEITASFDNDVEVHRAVGGKLEQVDVPVIDGCLAEMGETYYYNDDTEKSYSFTLIDVDGCAVTIRMSDGKELSFSEFYNLYGFTCEPEYEVYEWEGGDIND